MCYKHALRLQDLRPTDVLAVIDVPCQPCDTNNYCDDQDRFGQGRTVCTRIRSVSPNTVIVSMAVQT